MGKNDNNNMQVIFEASEETEKGHIRKKKKGFVIFISFYFL